MFSSSARRSVALTLLVASASFAIGCGDDSATSGSSAATTTSTGSGGSGGAGGAGGGGAEPIEAPDAEWTWVDFPESRCMSDTPTGIGINKVSGSDKVLIFLEGGNACFNITSCSVTANKNGYGASEFAESTSDLEGRPYFQRADDNPFKDYSFVYVPYCSGDLHAGRHAEADVGGKVRNFHGYDNMTAFLTRLAPTFPSASRVILSGISAGGLGATMNYDQTAKAFPKADVSLLDDSGPGMSKQYIPACLQKHFRDTWGLDKSLGGFCPECFEPDGTFVEPLINYLGTSYQDSSLAIISSTADHQISLFLAYGNDDCANVTEGFPADGYDAALYEAGIYDLRDRITKDFPKFYTYILDGSDGSDTTRHVWINDPVGVSSHGVLLTDWLAAFEAQSSDLVDVPPAQ